MMLRRYSDLLLRNRRHITIVVGLIAGWGALAWYGAGFYASHLEEQALETASSDAHRRANAVAAGIDNTIELFKYVPLMLSNDEAVRRVLRRFGPDAHPSTLSIAERRKLWREDRELAELSAQLEARAKVLDAEAIYVVNAAGDAVAGAPFTTQPTPLGTNYSDAHFFVMARAGAISHEYTIGRNTKYPGLNDATPIFENGRFIGAVVVRNSIRALARWIDPVNAFLVDKNGVVVLAADATLQDRALPNARIFSLTAAEKDRDYNRGAFEPIPITPWENGRLARVHAIGAFPEPVLLPNKKLAADGLGVYVRYSLQGLEKIAATKQLLFTALLALGGLAIVGIYSAALYVLKSREEAKAASRNAHQLTTTIANMPQGLCMFDADQRLLFCNDRYIDMYGMSRDQVVPGCNLRTILQQRKSAGNWSVDIEESITELTTQLKQGQPVSALSTLTDGRTIAVTNWPMQGGGWVSTHEDVTDRKISEARIEHLAHYDALTNLANRNLFRERIEECLARLRRLRSGFAVLLLDLDRFKAVNDMFGHQAGDLLLEQVAARIRGTIREIDVAARLGGDEFAVIVTPGEGSLIYGSQRLGTRLIDAIRAPYEVEGQQVVIGCSIGIAVAPEHGERSDELLKNADLALYKSKNSGRNCSYVYSAELKYEADSRNALENDLRQAIWREEFELFYQPIVKADTGRIKAVEALVRWPHPTRGLIAPGEFIPLAEETGLIVQLGEWVMAKACQDAYQMPDDIKITVNLSPVQFSKCNVVDTAIFALVDSQLPPARLEFEITEGVLLRETEQNLETLRQLKNLGVSIAMDDFGVGYSSLGYLTAFPFDKVKIDRSFVEKLDKPETKAVIGSIVQLARTLNLVTCAEGIETDAQLAEMKSLGIELAQGYLFGRPVPIADLDLTAVHSMGKAQAA